MLTHNQAIESLIEATVLMHQSGVPLMSRILPQNETIVQWEHYPLDDAIDAKTGSRYFYHCHPPEERGVGEHGHFHLFLSKKKMGKAMCKIPPPDLETNRANVVHVVGLSVNPDGIPIELFTTNRWVTDEWLYETADIMAKLKKFSLQNATDDPLVNQWLTALVRLAHPLIEKLLKQRDEALANINWTGDDHKFEILSRAPLNIQDLIEAD
jgi:hypothetical protein